MQYLNLLLFLITFTYSCWSQEVYKKTISFEWDPVPGAVKYEVKFINLKNGSAVETSQFTSTNSYYGAIPPGIYKMTLRSLDKRNVPGVWSPEVEFPVLLDKVKVQVPKEKDMTLQSQNDDYQEIEFAWNSVLGADKYILTIKDQESNKVVYENHFTELFTKVNLPVSQKYIWTLTAQDNANLKSDEEASGDITIFGKKLGVPEVQTPETQFV
ncbi:MAG: hypothetical protein L6Q37_05910, partial [Bdellovibrionaceae bacterium]|nr:hypothetical protein [Pseudobdellovibrionaceae bacterium]